MAAQESLHGEILLIRPLSLAFLTWLGISLGAALLGFLVFGRIADTAQVTGRLLSRNAADSASPLEAGFDVPSSWAPFVQAGTSLVIRCPGCTGLDDKLEGKVIRVERPVRPESPARVIVVLPFAMLPSLSRNNATLEAEIPLGRTSLIHWLLKPSSR